MTEKIKYVTLAVVLALIITVPVCNSQMDDDLYFEDVNVLIIGRCRTVFSSGTWTGRLFVGKQLCSGVGVHDSAFERLHVVVYNDSFSYSWNNLINKTISMKNATGIFFWGTKGFGVRKIPPIVFVWCYAEKLVIVNS